MFDHTNFTASAAAEPPKPARRPVAANLVCPPDVVYALRGPDGWYGAHVTKEPFPGVYTLTIQATDAHRSLGWRESDWRATEYPVPENHWIDLCTDGELHGQGDLVGLQRHAARRGAADVR
jgi:hypothetical protein